MSALSNECQDVMQVCLNGHVVTDLLRNYPEQSRTHCERCGAVTLDHCLTCGLALPGAIPVPGMIPVGTRHAPLYCPRCGAAFPWTKPLRGPAAPNALTTLENLLRRLPLVMRQLRSRQGDRPAFRVEDERDLEDLVRSVLPFHFDDVRPHGRTPRYAPLTRTDFLVADERIALTVKLAGLALREKQLSEQWQEDVCYYHGLTSCRTLLGFTYDPQGLLPQPRSLETVWSQSDGDLGVRWIIEG